MPKRLRRFCHGFANPSLPRSPSAIFLFFLLWWLRLSVVKKNKKASSTFLARSLRRFILNTNAIAKTACSLCAPCCCLAALAQPQELFLCESLAYSCAMPDHTKISHVVLRASWPPLAVPLRCTFKSGRPFPPSPSKPRAQWGAQVGSDSRK